jgi:hypothetical protein
MTIGRLHQTIEKGLRQQAGFALTEILVSILILMIGTLSTLSLVSNSNAKLSQTRAREAAVNLSRELLETAHDVPFTQIGEPNWFRDSLTSTPGQTGSVNTAGTQTTVQRRGVSFTVDVSACSVDDASDGFGAHPAGGHAWCSDSPTAGSADSQAEDFKRVTTNLTWSFKGRSQPPLVQTATFGANGAAIGPAVSSLSITSPSGLSATQPTITSPSTTTVTFSGTSAGANDMRFSVDGVEQTTGVSNQGSGTWQFNWDISQLTDGTYLIGATAVDALATRGPTRTLQVKLARSVPMTPRNVTGNYNYVYVSGTKTLAVELGWDANPEGNVTGYEVLKGSTTVCSASLAITCVDLNAASTGSTTYTVRTLYNDGAGNPGAVSTSYSVTAPTLLSPSHVRNIGQSSCGAYDNWELITATGVAAVGDRVVLRFESRGDPGGTVAAFDSKSNTYSKDADFINSSNGQRVVVFSANITTAIASGDTIAVNHPSGADSWALAADVFTNVAATNPVDSVGTGVDTGSNPISASVTTSNATDLLVGAVSSANSRSVTQPSGWTGFTTQNPSGGGTCRNGSNGNSTNAGAYRGVSSTGTYTYNPSLSGSGSWIGAVVAYKSNGESNLARPGTPTGLSITANADGTRTLTWNAPSGTPAVEFYRIYRDGRDYTDRIDTAGATGSSVTWTDTNAGGTSHTYRVTAATSTLIESSFAGPVSG